MLTTFNCGIGLLLIVAEENVGATMATLQDQGEAPVQIGAIVPADHQPQAGQILIGK